MIFAIFPNKIRILADSKTDYLELIITKPSFVNRLLLIRYAIVMIFVKPS